MDKEYWKTELKGLMNEAGEICGGWNGKDKMFMVGGEIYNEEDAHIADDIVEKIKELLELFGD